MNPIRVCVVGAGVMGALHARTIARVADRRKEGRLVAVVDRHVGRARAVAGPLGARASDDLASQLASVDAVVVAVPTRDHVVVSRAALAAGLDLLVEKPLAPSSEAGRGLVQQARAADRILQVGHVEWYNPAWRAAARRAGRLERIEVERLNPPIARGLDIDVVQDFMLHDLDWVTRWVGEDVVEIEASGRRVSNPGLDEAEAVLGFDSGCTAKLRASRVHDGRRRVVELIGRDGRASADLLARPADRPTDGSAAVEVEAPDPLELQWLAFLEACRTRKAPENDGAVGVAALELVERVRSAIAAGS